MPFDLSSGDANRARQLFVRLAPSLRVAGVDKNYSLAAIHPSHHLFGGHSVYNFLSSRISHVLRTPTESLGTPPILACLLRRSQGDLTNRPRAVQNALVRPSAAYKSRHVETLLIHKSSQRLQILQRIFLSG